jgi:DNA polymerase elongation subunit (family B)
MEHELSRSSNAKNDPLFCSLLASPKDNVVCSANEAEERAIKSVGGESVWNSLPDIVKKKMIESQEENQQMAKEKQQMAKEKQQMAERLAESKNKLSKYEEEERKRQEEERKRQEEERKRIAYQEQKKREAVVTRRQLAESGVPNRVAYDWTPFKLNRVEVGHLDISCEFQENEPYPLSLLGGLIHGFRRSTIEAFVPQMQDIWDRAVEHDDVQRGATGYIMFHLWTGSMRRTSTRAIQVSANIMDDLDLLFEALDIMLDKIEAVKAGYNYIYGGNEISYVHLYFRANYYPEPKSVNNWGHGVKPIERRQAFDIFTASDLDVPCAVQVAKRLWPVDLDSPDESRHKEATESDLDSIVKRAGNKLCILKPHSSVRFISEITDYSDLVIEACSPVKSLSTIDHNYIYLLHFNEHVGLLENVKEQKRRRQYTSFRPVQKYPKTKKITMCFDIECYFDPYNDQRHVPYLCCACFVYDDEPGNVVEFEGKDCVAQMLDYAAENVGEFGLKNIELIAHNGGGYDFHYILSSISNPGAIKNILIRNNHFISFSFKHMGVNFSVKDSLNFLLCSLTSSAKAFLGGELSKTDFPHHEVRSADDLQRTFNKWISTDKIINVSVEKEKMLVMYEDVVRYSDENNESKKLISWAKEYCCNDVIVLAKVWVKFKSTVTDIFNCHIVDQTHTLAGLSFRLFEAHLAPKIKLHHPPKADFINMRESLIGGRCISLNGMYHNVVCVDVKSLYPTAMAYYDQPYGNYRKVVRKVDSELGIYWCKVVPYGLLSTLQSKVARENHGFFPLRNNDQVTYSGNSLPTTPCSICQAERANCASCTKHNEYKAWYTSVDMKIGEMEGHYIEPVSFDSQGHVGYSWTQKGKIFKDYIEGILYKLKLQYEEAGDKEKRQVIKIIMNSLWGKFAQKWMDTQYKIKDETACDMENEECYKIWDTEWFMVKSHQTKTNASKPVQNGVFVLSWARYHMKMVWEKIAKPGCCKQYPNCVGHTPTSGAVCIYSDTDSMFIKADQICDNAVFKLNGRQKPVIGDEMGQLEVEAVFDQLICVGKKQYIGSYKQDGITKYKKRFKGVPIEYVKPEMYTHLLKSTDHKVQIDFLKFKREWGAVHGYIESKTVTAT